MSSGFCFVLDGRVHVFANKDNDIEALLNVAYNVTENISSQAILRHNNIFNRYLPALLYLPHKTPLYASVSKGAASTIFTSLVWCGHRIRTHNLPLLKKLYQLGAGQLSPKPTRSISTRPKMQNSAHANLTQFKLNK